MRTVGVPQFGAQSVRVREGAVLDAGGMWINDVAAAGGPGETPLWIDGGSVDVSSGVAGAIAIEDGVRIDVSGGAWRRIDGGIVAGDGGDIGIDTGGTLRLGNVELDAHALEQGGSFDLAAGTICIGGAACAEDDPSSVTLVLAPEFFRNGGFGSYGITAFGGLTVAGDADLRPVQMNRVIGAADAGQSTGSDIAGIGRVELLPDHLRRAADITLRTTGDHPTELRVEQGAVIAVDPGAAITLESNSRLWMDGVLSAPGGTITLERGGSDRGIYLHNDAVWLGQNAVIDVSGIARMQPNPLGLRIGEVMDGGTVRLRALSGYVIAEAGSVIDVSGTSASLDLQNGIAGYRQREVSGDAGAIDIEAREGVILDGTLRGEAGSASSRGGSLSLRLDGNDRGEPAPGSTNNFPHAPRVIEVVAGEAGNELAGFTYDTMDSAFTAAHNGIARLHTSTISAGGFDALALSARHLLSTETSITPIQVIAPGSVSIATDLRLGRSLVIDAPTITAAVSEVTIAAPYVALGSTNPDNQSVPTPLPVRAISWSMRAGSI